MSLDYLFKAYQHFHNIPQQRWLWHAIDHATGKVLAYVLAPDEDVAFLELKSLLKPFGITRFFTDGWGAYQRHLDQQVHIVGKSNPHSSL